MPYGGFLGGIGGGDWVKGKGGNALALHVVSRGFEGLPKKNIETSKRAFFLLEKKVSAWG